jgi:hypothetical protein
VGLARSILLLPARAWRWLMEAAAESPFGVVAVVGCLSWYVLGVLVWAPGLAEVGEPYWGVDGVWSGVVDGVLAGLFASAILFVPLAVIPSVAAGIVLARHHARGVPSPPFDCLRAWLIAPTPAILPAAAFAPFVAVNVAEYHTMYDEAVGEAPAPWMQSVWLDVVGSWWIPVVIAAGALMLAVVAACGAFGKELTRRPTRCPWCGYDRTGIATVTRCPECGKAPTMNPVSAARDRSWFARQWVLRWHAWKAFCERRPFAAFLLTAAGLTVCLAVRPLWTAYGPRYPYLMNPLTLWIALPLFAGVVCAQMIALLQPGLRRGLGLLIAACGLSAPLLLSSLALECAAFAHDRIKYPKGRASWYLSRGFEHTNDFLIVLACFALAVAIWLVWLCPQARASIAADEGDSTGGVHTR